MSEPKPLFLGDHNTQSLDLAGLTSEDSILGKLNIFDRPIEQYLDVFAPSRTACPTRRCRGAFSAPGPSTNDHADMVISGLTELISDFPECKRLQFMKTTEKIPLDIAGRESVMPLSMPGILTSFPGETLKNPQWNDISLVWHTEARKMHDPVERKDKLTLLQLIQYARNLMAANLSLAVYIVGVYGNTARIYRFDRAGFVVSRPFSYLARPNLLRQFLWRFTHPDADCMVLGADPSISVPTPADLEWARNLVDAEIVCSGFLERHSRWLSVTPRTPGGIERQFLTIEPLDRSLAMFSRATMAWTALERGDNSGARYVLKDAWRSLRCRPETRIYEHIHARLGEGEELFGVADMACGIDLGEDEVPLHHTVSYSAGDCCGSRTPFRIKIPAPGGVRARARASHYTESPPTISPCHRTISGLGHPLASRALEERSHMRLVYKPVGRYLGEFESTRQLIEAIRDAIRGHKRLYELGVLHRDVSDSNIMLADNEVFKGFIGDFDMSVLTGEYVPPGQPMGTWQVSAIEVLENADTVVQNARHDLESFFWVLTIFVTQHTNHDHRMGKNVVNYLFDGKDFARAPVRKRRWLKNVRNVSVHGNAPLTYLLRVYGKLCRLNLDWPGELGAAIPLTHDSVLQVFDRALAMSNWPVGDAAIPYDPSVLSGRQALDGCAETIVSTASCHPGQDGKKRKWDEETEEVKLKIHIKRPKTGHTH